MEIIWILLVIIIIVKLVELIIKNIGVILLCGGIVLAIYLIKWAIQSIRAEKQREEEKFLRELSRGSAELLEAVAHKIMNALEVDPYRQEVKSFIHWKILDTDLEHRRVLVKPLNRDEFTALVGKDLYNNRPFLLITPPSVSTVENAMAWIYNLSDWKPEKEV